MEINCAYDSIVNPKELKFLSNNPNIHSEKQIKQLAKILEFQGQRRPLIVDKATNEVVCGNGTLQAILLNGSEKCAVNYQSFSSPELRYAFIVSDNAIKMQSGLDIELVKMELGSLDLGDIDLLGFRDFTMEAMPELEPVIETKPKAEKKCPHCGEKI